VDDIEGPLMMWLAWRQFRTAAYAVTGFLLVLATAYLITGPHLAHVYDTVVKTCAAKGDCGSVTSTFLSDDSFLRHFGNVLLLFPALLGMFWGAPLVAREMESGTFRLAWTQSVTRQRWFLTRVGLLVAATVVATGLFSLMVTWWSSPFDTLDAALFNNFEVRDIAPVGYAVFALMLGVCAGVLIRRTVFAMGATLVAFAAVRIGISYRVRQRFASPLHLTTPFQLPFTTSNGSVKVGGGLNPGDWIVSSNIVNAQGHVVGQSGGIGPNGGIGFQAIGNGRTEFVGVGVCPNRIPASTGISRRDGPGVAVQHALNTCVAHFHLREVLTYFPPSRYWGFQWYEFSLYFGMAIVLGAVALWWVRARMT
jgi:ABC-type transport system involved in multi-copper enzyme maturation permease subunit